MRSRTLIILVLFIIATAGGAIAAASAESVPGSPACSTCLLTTPSPTPVPRSVRPLRPRSTATPTVPPETIERPSPGYTTRQPAARTPTGQPNCTVLKQQYSEAVDAGNVRLVEQLRRDLSRAGCGSQPIDGSTRKTIHYSVGPTKTVTWGPNNLPSEAQSTVIPPGVNHACMSGALLVSNDFIRPPNYGVVITRSLSGNGDDRYSEFYVNELEDLTANYVFGTNDHDLVTLSDGNVLYLTGAWSKKPLDKKPAWWDYAYRGDFGPGARSNLMVWKSYDCGATFYQVGEMDPAQIGDGSCAYPQGHLDRLGHYDMGGSDGQLVKVDSANDDIYLTFQCVGKYYTRDAGKFTLTKPLNKTLVAVSSDRGSNWQGVGYIDIASWRFGILPLNGRLAFGRSNTIIFSGDSATKLLRGNDERRKYDDGLPHQFSKAQPLIGQYGGFNWNPFPFNPNPDPERNMHANVWANTVITRAGESNDILLAYPTIVGTGPTATNGYSVFFHDLQNRGSYLELSPITPLTHVPTDFVMNVTAIDLGKGPVLLYWMDVNASTHTARMRGRVILDIGKYSSDFDITNDIDLTSVNRKSANPNGPRFFYGDYHTAGGYIGRSLGKEGENFSQGFQGNNNDVVYRFYPLWVDRHMGAQYAVVTVSEGTHTGDGRTASAPLGISTVARDQWKGALAPVNVEDLGSLPSVIQAPEIDAERKMPATPNTRPSSRPRPTPRP